MACHGLNIEIYLEPLLKWGCETGCVEFIFVVVLDWNNDILLSI